MSKGSKRRPASKEISQERWDKIFKKLHKKKDRADEIIKLTGLDYYLDDNERKIQIR